MKPIIFLTILAVIAIARLIKTKGRDFSECFYCEKFHVKQNAEICDCDCHEDPL